MRFSNLDQMLDDAADDAPSHIYQCPDCGKVDLLCECGDDGPAFVLVPNSYRGRPEGE